MLMYDAELVAFVGAGAVLVRKSSNRSASEYPDGPLLLPEHLNVTRAATTSFFMNVVSTGI